MSAERHAAAALLYVSLIHVALATIEESLRPHALKWHDAAFVTAVSLYRAGLAGVGAQPLPAAVLIKTFYPCAAAPAGCKLWVEALGDTGRLRAGTRRASLGVSEHASLIVCAHLGLASRGYGHTSPTYVWSWVESSRCHSHAPFPVPYPDFLVFSCLQAVAKNPRASGWRWRALCFARFASFSRAAFSNAVWGRVVL
jgi:hypothetical protein